MYAVICMYVYSEMFDYSFSILVKSLGKRFVMKHYAVVIIRSGSPITMMGRMMQCQPNFHL